MSPTITWPTDTADSIDAIRNAIGRNIVINVTVSGTPCPASGCLLDPVTGLSTDQFCAVCSGFYYINTASGYTVLAHVNWGQADTPIWETGGRVVEGDCLVQIKYTVANETAVDDSKSFVVDGKVLVKEAVDYRGVPNINRILVTLTQEE
jgi:hypothetical protein